ncbi:HDOD domain-containing protein [Reinekea blandensis]|uniref:HDOD domain-containing protein n=1 Tax=Reinekea blandensis MED297 TaxID=314283 RepID=A4BE59_9GAMM|nr:HDOD domain-containing protein [Reinekea blandensis]EAR09537.1 hypothetical protein MED297_12437 [Reinekea blandensis MED297]
MTAQSPWFTKVQQLNLPAVLPISALPDSQASLGEWMTIIREDPLLTIHLFRYANKMLASHDVSVRTLEHAVNLLGATRLVALTGKVQRVDGKSGSAKGLLRAIGDSLLAASLMRQWFEIRQIPWTEADYWVTLFYDLGIWMLWILEPEKMEHIEFRVKQGDSREQLLTDMIQMPLRQWNAMLCAYFQLPVLPDEDNEQVAEQPEQRIQPFKQSALKFFLPFSHELAFSVRQNWHSDSLDTLCRTGEISLGLTEFKPMLKQWVAVAAREFRLPHAALAARRLLAQQPAVSLQRTSSGFSQDDMKRANQLSQNRPAPIVDPTPEPAPDLASWPEARSATPSATQPGQSATTGQGNPTPSRRSQVDLNIQREIRRQFRNQKTWHSPIEIQESALYGLRKGLSLSRIVVLEESNGFWAAFDSEGCQNHPLLRNLKVPMNASDILTELSKRVTALWVNDNNRRKAGKMLPPPLLMAAENESFFLRSFAIGTDVTMLIYADAFGQEEPLSANDYQLFREYCADWNTALNKMRL